jgi:hypothetical protein
LVTDASPPSLEASVLAGSLPPGTLLTPVDPEGTDTVAEVTEDGFIQVGEITRITTPLGDRRAALRTGHPVDPDDFDENAWSKKLAKHVEAEYEHEVGVCRELFVNSDRWCPWETYDGQRMLPEAWPVIGLEREWIGISVNTDNDDITWTHRTALGLVGEGVAACLYEPDLEWEIDPSEVGVWRRNGTVDRDARIVVDWLLNSPFQRARGFSIERMLTRFFLEVAGTGRDEGVIVGHRLAVGYDPLPDAGQSGH